LEILAIGVLALEWAFRAFTSSRVYSRRLTDFFDFGTLACSAVCTPNTGVHNAAELWTVPDVQMGGDRFALR
jgi:hypothetical protein